MYPHNLTEILYPGNTAYYITSIIYSRITSVQLQRIVDVLGTPCIYTGVLPSVCCTGCPKKKDTVTLSHNFRLNYQNSKFQAKM